MISKLHMQNRTFVNFSILLFIITNIIFILKMLSYQKKTLNFRKEFIISFKRPLLIVSVLSSRILRILQSSEPTFRTLVRHRNWMTMTSTSVIIGNTFSLSLVTNFVKRKFVVARRAWKNLWTAGSRKWGGGGGGADRERDEREENEKRATRIWAGDV